MTFESHSIVTPEGVTLELPLAGIASRGMAAFIDAIIRTAVLVGLAFAFGGVELGISGPLLLAFYLVSTFLLIFVYDVIFEVANRGRTPGKMALSLRVVQAGGGQVRLADSAVRNLVRIVDFLPAFYLVGIIAAAVHPRAQRLGDMAAGTIVVREGRRPSKRRPAPRIPEPRPAPAGWDVSAVEPADTAAIRAFLQRRASLDGQTRTAVAGRLASRIGTRVVRPAGVVDPEDLLETVLAAKMWRG